MLTNLTIKNFGLIDSAAIDLVKNLNILTGETGAGKSIIIDALRFALGERMESSQVRNPELACIVEALFDLSGNDLLKNHLFKEYVSPYLYH
jgi:DNA repair protein RecN (Recombination protein N)